ncbi:MAG: AbrB/MazE/SpoVT family DNA-binding domain-containing protein [Persephonella sp.]|nr:AbrB/MazE/SpoVT family DNA-binding domain-containing protein [Persephonella sp.]
MKKTKIFKSGNSLAVRIPKGYHINAEEVYITKQDNRLVIFPEKEKWDVLFDMLEETGRAGKKRFSKRKKPTRNSGKRAVLDDLYA